MSETKRLAQQYLKAPYARILIPEDDGTYSAEILEFPGCFAEGDTLAEAMQNLERTAAAWIKATLEQGQDIPEPHATHGYSGKTNLRLPRSIHKKAAQFARRDDVSLNQFLACAAAARVGAEEFFDHLVSRLEDRLRPTGSVISVNVQHVLTLGVLSLSDFQMIPFDSCCSPPYQRVSVCNPEELDHPTTGTVFCERVVTNG